MKNQTNPAIGSSWEALQTKLFSKEELKPVTKEWKNSFRKKWVNK